MKTQVEVVSVNAILAYAFAQDKDNVTVWENVVLDPTTIKPMMCNGAAARNRKGFGLFIGSDMVGYAVVDESYHCLDLMHITADLRGQGLGKAFLKQLDIKRVCVDACNHAAINLYTQMGYEIEYLEDA